MKRSLSISFLAFGLLLLGLWLLGSQELPLEAGGSSRGQASDTAGIVTSQGELIRSTVSSKEPPLALEASPLMLQASQGELAGRLSGYVAPGWVDVWGGKPSVRIFSLPGEEVGAKPMLVKSQTVGFNSMYQMSVPEGEYIPGIRIGGTTFFGEAIRLSADKEAVCNFYPSEGNRVFGAFQYELQPEYSTFSLEVFRESDMKLICSRQLTPNSSLANSPDAEEDQDLNNIDRRKPHGYFSIDELPPDNYILRFSSESNATSGPRWFVWEHSVDLLFGDCDFDTQFADFTPYKEFLVTELPR